MTRRNHAEQASDNRQRHRTNQVMKIKQPRTTGLTLIELLIVVVILSTLASVIAPSFFNNSEESKIAAAITTVKGIKKKIQAYYLQNDQWPTAIDRAWFVNKKYPRNPFTPDFEGDSVKVASSPAHEHPWLKTIENTGLPPFWYNPNNGLFRLRVSTQATDLQTITLYNHINDSNVASINGRVDGL